MFFARIMVAGLTLLPAMTCMAQQAQPLTYVALFRVEAQNQDAFLARGKQYIPTLDKLMADGVVTAYGMDQDVMHHPERLNVAFWYTVANYTNLQKAEEAIEAFQAKSPELIKATSALTDMKKHLDILVRTVEGNSSKASQCKNPVSTFSRSVVRPGKRREYMEAYRKYQKPVLEKLVASGAICSYSLDVEDLHTMEMGTTWSIVTAPNLGATDAVDAAFEEAGKLLSESERAARTKAYQDLTDPAKHEDSIARSVVFKAK